MKWRFVKQNFPDTVWNPKIDPKKGTATIKARDNSRAEIEITLRFDGDDIDPVNKLFLKAPGPFSEEMPMTAQVDDDPVH